MNSRLTILALGAAMALASGPGLAQTAAPPISQGPAVPGLCVLGVGQAISDSTVGQYVNTRLQQLAGQVKAELQPEGDAITAEDRRLQAQRATLAPAALQSQAQALQARLVAYQQKAQLRQREMEATQQKALNRIAQELDPIAKQLYQQHRCSALIDKNAVMLVNPEMDLTAQAVTMLNARITQFPFERENLQAQAATTAPARR
ncbi:MAG TPA: OmpH family outer membrane protein [Caulobacteraceae bacterium]|nr:OmpH family outer membrane protein [Caulobacteraceae bacterium]